MALNIAGFWRVSYQPARAFLLERGLYMLVGLDAWLLMLEHGARYGMGNFNVAQLGVIDRMLPRVDATLYVALVMGSGLLAFAAGFFQLARWLRLLLFASYTAAWAISLHDSYQHHYFLSWQLLFAAWLPAVDSRFASAPDRRIVGAALPSAALSCAILYLFTGISKMSSEWQSGLVLKVLARSEGPFGWLPWLVSAVGAPEPWPWRIAALMLVALQWTVALGYALSSLRDERPTRAIGWICSIAWLAAWSFHVVTELDGQLAIGWFSYYMLWLSFVFFAPASLLARLCRPFGALADKLRHALYAQPPSLLLAGSVAGLLSWLAAHRADMPGAREACGAVFVLFLAQMLVAWLRAELDQALRSAAVLATAMLSLLAVLELTSIRFDYYRRAAGESTRMGRLEEALTLYRKAEQHAPPGRTRMTKIDQLERALDGASDERSDKGEP